MSEIKPALTPEEWVSWTRDGDPRPQISFDGERWHPSLHALAALCLHAQSFGFTHEDVAMLRANATGFEYVAGQVGANLDGEAAKMRDLADRIEALIPPST